MPIISVASPKCPYCDSNEVALVGADAAAKRQGKRNMVWKCAKCEKRFSDLSVKAAERKRRLED